MNNQPKPKSGAPLLIIGLVFIVAILGVVYFLQTSTPSTANNNNNAERTPAPSQPRGQTIPSNAPPGAQPPNMKGAPNATVTIEEFADFQCPMCANMYPIMNSVHAAYGSRIKFIYRNFPLQMHKHGYDAAVAAEAAYLQDANKFWDMQNLLFTNQTTWAALEDPRPTFRGYAEKIGLDTAKWDNDVAGLAAKNRVNEDMERGRGVSISSTPTIFINGTALTQAQFNFDSIKQIIDAELAKASGPSNPPPAQPPSSANANK